LGSCLVRAAESMYYEHMPVTMGAGMLPQVVREQYAAEAGDAGTHP